MKNSIILCLIALIMGIVCYVSIGNILFSIIIFLLALIDGLFLIDKSLKKFALRILKYQECYQFVSNMSISLSINPSLISAYDNTIKMVGGPLEEENSSLSDMDPMEKLDYLKQYFSLKDFDVFCDLLKSWNENGGDILKTTDYLLCQMREREEYISYSQNAQKSKTIEFSILWIVCYAILIALKFALTNYYAKISSQILYQISIFAFFIFSILSINIFISKICHLDIEGIEYEK